MYGKKMKLCLGRMGFGADFEEKGVVIDESKVQHKGKVKYLSV